MKRTTTFFIIILLVLTNDVIAQLKDEVGHTVTQWSNWSTSGCHKGIAWRSRQNFYGGNNGYTWEYEVKNNYGRQVTFSFKFGESGTGNRKTLSSNQVYRNTALPNANYFESAVYSVCFSNDGRCKDDCYSPCDNGTPNIPNCNSSSTGSNTNSFNGTNQNSSQQTQQQNIANQQEQERQQQELKRQQDAQRTAAYVDLGVQTIKSVSGLISSIREEKRAKSDLEWREKVKKYELEASEKEIEIKNKINQLSQKYEADHDIEHIKKVGDLHYEISNMGWIQDEKKSENKNIAINLYSYCIRSNYFKFDIVQRSLEYYANSNNIPDKSKRKAYFSDFLHYFTSKMNSNSFQKDTTGEKYFNCAKILALAVHLSSDNNFYTINDIIEVKKQEKYWLEKSVELKYPKAMVVKSHYLEVGDFFYAKNIEKSKNILGEAVSLGFNCSNCNTAGKPDNTDVIKFNSDETTKLNELFQTYVIKHNNGNKIKNYLTDLSYKHGYSYQKNNPNFEIPFDKFNVSLRRPTVVKIFPVDFDVIKLFGNLEFNLLIMATYSDKENVFNYGDYYYEGNEKQFLRFPEYQISFQEVNKQYENSTTSDKINKILETYSIETSVQKE